MRVLGAVLAGGRSLRFGSDKALAMLRGKPLIDNVIDALAPQVDAVVICGRDHGGLLALADRPGPGQGPLAGLSAALHHAAAAGFDRVLSVGCDMPDLPADLVARLGGAPAVADGQWLVGLWPATLATRLDAHLAAGNRSLRGWADAVGAARIALPPLANINRIEDLAALAGSSD